MSTLFALAAALVPILGGVLLLAVKFEKQRRLHVFMMLTLMLCAGLVAASAASADSFISLFTITRGFVFAFKIDNLSRIFSLLAVTIWLVVLVYCFGYMAHDHAKQRFYAFFLMTAGAVLGICCAANLLTMYVFYEAMTLASFPLVLHEQSPEAFAACKKYLIYSFVGAALALIGIFYFSFVTGGAAFASGGVARIVPYDEKFLQTVYFIMVVGFGCKAGMFPLNAWLTSAHPIAPSPASAVLSGVITKMGVFAIIRATYYVVGADFIYGSWVQTALIVLACISILIGSVLAYRTDHLKKRLAYSTISQVSYILLGVFLLNATALKGALLHVVFHALMKTVLFLSAGAMIFKTRRVNVSEMRGVGRTMPLTMAFFTVAAICMVGVPPLGGFISKTYLIMGALASGIPALPAYAAGGILILSALLSAGYLLPIAVNGYFPGDAHETVALKDEPPLSMRLGIGAAAVLLAAVSLAPAYFSALIADTLTKLF